MGCATEANIHTALSLKAAIEVGIAAVKRENEQLRFLADELSHRMKNLVAIVQAIARQTMHQTTTKEDFEARFAGRVLAFGRSLDLLIANNWRGARIDDIVRSELATFGVLDGLQISIKGPPLGLNPEATRSIALAIHELATNASKFGALSVPEGKVAVHWDLVDGGERQRFHMTWRESDGPMVTEPKRRGFGRQVIEQLTAQTLAGSVTHEFLPVGVMWTLDAPVGVVKTRNEPASAMTHMDHRNGRTQHASR